MKFNEKYFKEISLYDFDGLRIGSAEDEENGTGVTVAILGDKGAPAGIDVRGGGPASRESELLNPLANAKMINAILLSGGSAFGLDAAGGVQQYLEERDIGYDVGICKVPLVCQADIFDLGVVTHKVRPDKKMAYEACLNSEKNNLRNGNYGAGTGATIGKIGGKNTAMKSGLGSFCVQVDDIKVGALVAVNALGDIYDEETGKKIAGTLTPDGKGLADTYEAFYSRYRKVENAFTSNTTIGIIFTNAAFSKAELCKIASMTHDGYARVIKPVHTTADGDTIFATSMGDKQAAVDYIGQLACDVMAEAITRAVKSSESKYGFKGYMDL